MERTEQPSQRNYVIRGSEKDYDALQAEQTIREFCAFIRSVIARYDENARQQEIAEARRMDLQHAIELTEELTDEEEHQLYGKLTEALRIRRICKHENMLLKPLYDQVVDKNLLNRLAQIQGQIGTVRKTIADKSYACRTDAVPNLLRISDDKRFEDVRNVRPAVWRDTPIGEVIVEVFSVFKDCSSELCTGMCTTHRMRR